MQIVDPDRTKISDRSDDAGATDTVSKLLAGSANAIGELLAGSTDTIGNSLTGATDSVNDLLPCATQAILRQLGRHATGQQQQNQQQQAVEPGSHDSSSPCFRTSSSKL
ncbi:MAG: hypothetical protein AB2720_10765 [Candidatus Thiodiazotropha taylori]